MELSNTASRLNLQGDGKGGERFLDCASRLLRGGEGEKKASACYAPACGRQAE